tara:strand:+ start:16 stop:1497 length:1482 start_codon:yes stop_codon:yes gene_type:complete
MAISAPRQRTTFKKDKKTGKVKGTTTYRAPERESADEQLDRYIRDNQNKKNQSAGIKSIVTDMPSKFADGFDFDAKNNLVNPTPGKKSKYFRKDGSLNEAGKYILGVYSDERPEYSRGLNRLVKSSPEMAQAYARRFPLTNFAMNIIPSALPLIGPAFTADKAIKANRRKQEILNTPVNRPEGGFKNFVEFFKPKMNSEQTANTEIIEGEKEPLINPSDINIQKAVNPSFASPQDMGFLDDENIFDPEKAAIESALAPGDVFDPVAADKRNKVDFINQVEGTNFTVDDAELRFNIDDQFERSKQKQGMIIRDDVNIEEEAPVIGQFDLTDQGAINLTGAPDQTTEGVREQIDMNTADPNLDIFTNQAFMGSGPNFPAGGVKTEGEVNTGLDMIGNKVFPSEGGSQTALDILNSNATDGDFSGYPTMRFNNDVKRSFVDDNYGNPNPDFIVNDQRFVTPGERDFNRFAEGGSTNKYQNMSTHEKLMRMAKTMYG